MMRSTLRTCIAAIMICASVPETTQTSDSSTTTSALSQLMSAIKGDDNAKAKRILKQHNVNLQSEGCVINYAEDDTPVTLYFTPLQFAALKGNAELVEYLLTHFNVDPNIQSKGGVTPLHLAAEYGGIETVQTLLNDPRTNSLLQMVTGTTARDSIKLAMFFNPDKNHIWHMLTQHMTRTTLTDLYHHLSYMHDALLHIET